MVYRDCVRNDWGSGCRRGYSKVWHWMIGSNGGIEIVLWCRMWLLQCHVFKRFCSLRWGSRWLRKLVCGFCYAQQRWKQVLWGQRNATDWLTDWSKGFSAESHEDNSGVTGLIICWLGEISADKRGGSGIVSQTAGVGGRIIHIFTGMKHIRPKSTQYAMLLGKYSIRTIHVKGLPNHPKWRNKSWIFRRYWSTIRYFLSTNWL